MKKPKRKLTGNFIVEQNFYGKWVMVGLEYTTEEEADRWKTEKQRRDPGAELRVREVIYKY